MLCSWGRRQLSWRLWTDQQCPDSMTVEPACVMLHTTLNRLWYSEFRLVFVCLLCVMRLCCMGEGWYWLGTLSSCRRRCCPGRPSLPTWSAACSRGTLLPLLTIITIIIIMKGCPVRLKSELSTYRLDQLPPCLRVHSCLCSHHHHRYDHKTMSSYDQVPAKYLQIQSTASMLERYTPAPAHSTNMHMQSFMYSAYLD